MDSSALANKIKADLDTIFSREDTVTSKALMNQKFQQNWQTKPSYVSLHSGVGKSPSSLVRTNIAPSDRGSHSNLPSLPLIGGSHFKRIAHGISSVDKVDNLSSAMVDLDEESMYAGSQMLRYAHKQRLLQYAEQSSHQSAFGEQLSSQYHMDLLEEKREEI